MLDPDVQRTWHTDTCLCHKAAAQFIVTLGIKGAYSTVLDARGTEGIFTDSSIYAAAGFRILLKGNCYV